MKKMDCLKDCEEEKDLPDIVEARLQTILKEGANAFMDFKWLQPELPTFFDEKKFLLGQRLFYNNAFSMMVAKLCGLLSLLSIPPIKDVLKFTGQSGTTCAAFRRYASTILHTWVWYERKPGIEKEMIAKDTKNALKVNLDFPRNAIEMFCVTKIHSSEALMGTSRSLAFEESSGTIGVLVSWGNLILDWFLESLKIVRKKHCVAFLRTSQAGLHRVSQLDMALTQFGFMGFTLLSGDYLGVNTTYEELEGLIHFWHVVGSMLGMEEKYNICTGSVEETRALCRRLLDEMFLPSLAKSNEDFEEMSRILLESLWPVNPFLEHKAFVTFTYTLASVSAANNNHPLKIDTSTLSWYSTCILNFQIFVHQYLLSSTYWWSSFFRLFLNAIMRLAIYLTENLPFLAYWTYGVKNSHVKIYKYRVL